MVQNPHLTKLGGIGGDGKPIIVQIDESFCGRNKLNIIEAKEGNKHGCWAALNAQRSCLKAKKWENHSELPSQTDQEQHSFPFLKPRSKKVP